MINNKNYFSRISKKYLFTILIMFICIVITSCASYNKGKSTQTSSLLSTYNESGIFSKENNYFSSISNSFFSSQSSTSKIIDTSKEPVLSNIVDNYKNESYKQYYFNLGMLGTYEEYAAIRAVQGIVNRKAPRLLVEANNAYFKDTDLELRKLYQSKGYEFNELKTFKDVMVAFKDDFNGIISISGVTKSYNGWFCADADFGVMMASITGFMPVPQSLVSSIESSTNLKLVTSFNIGNTTVLGDTGKFLKDNGLITSTSIYAFIFNNFIQSFDDNRYMSLTGEGLDFAIQKKMFYMDIKPSKPEDKALNNRVNSYFASKNKLWFLYGWVEEESSGLEYICNNGGILRCLGSSNLSFISKIAGPKMVKQKSKFKLNSYDSQKKYITFMVSENDTLKALTTFQHGAWLDPNRGKVPINWGVPAYAIEEFSSMVDYYYNSATSNDYFFSGGGSLAGFVDYDSQMPSFARNDLIQKNKYLAPLLDQKYVDLYNDKYSTNDIFNKNDLGLYIKNSGLEGAITTISGSNMEFEKWNDQFVYNRNQRMYPYRDSLNSVKNQLYNKINESEWDIIPSDNSGDYWYVKSDISNITKKVGVRLFTQSDKTAYGFYIDSKNAYITYGKIQSEEILITIPINNMTKHNFRAIADSSYLFSDKTKLTLYIDQIKVAEIFDNRLEKGGCTFLNTGGKISDAFNFNQSGFGVINKSMSEQLADDIIRTGRKFSVGYYGYVFSSDYEKNQLSFEPGPGELMGISPTDIYNISLVLEKRSPNTYEFVNLDEYMTYAKEYYK